MGQDARRPRALQGHRPRAIVDLNTHGEPLVTVAALAARLGAARRESIFPPTRLRLGRAAHGSLRAARRPLL